MTGPHADAAQPGARPLHIVMVVDGFYPSTGGSEMQARLLARELASRGHTVEVVCPQLDRRMAPSEKIDGIPVTRITYPEVRRLGHR